jgi:hypothetical protein
MDLFEEVGREGNKKADPGIFFFENFEKKIRPKRASKAQSLGFSKRKAVGSQTKALLRSQ